MRYTHCPPDPIKRWQPSLIVTIGWVHDISHFIITVSTLHCSPFFTLPPAHASRIHYIRERPFHYILYIYAVCTYIYIIIRTNICLCESWENRRQHWYELYNIIYIIIWNIYIYIHQRRGYEGGGRTLATGQGVYFVGEIQKSGSELNRIRSVAGVMVYIYVSHPWKCAYCVIAKRNNTRLYIIYNIYNIVGRRKHDIGLKI